MCTLGNSNFLPLCACPWMTDCKNAISIDLGLYKSILAVGKCASTESEDGFKDGLYFWKPLVDTGSQKRIREVSETSPDPRRETAFLRLAGKAAAVSAQGKFRRQVTRRREKSILVSTCYTAVKEKDWQNPLTFLTGHISPWLCALLRCRESEEGSLDHVEGGHGAEPREWIGDPHGSSGLLGNSPYTFCREGECTCYILIICEYEDCLVFLMVVLEHR